MSAAIKEEAAAGSSRSRRWRGSSPPFCRGGGDGANAGAGAGGALGRGAVNLASSSSSFSSSGSGGCAAGTAGAAVAVEGGRCWGGGSPCAVRGVCAVVEITIFRRWVVPLSFVAATVVLAAAAAAAASAAGEEDTEEGAAADGGEGADGMTLLDLDSTVRELLQLVAAASPPLVAALGICLFPRRSKEEMLSTYVG
jgi:hypothetical protein